MTQKIEKLKHRSFKQLFGVVGKINVERFGPKMNSKSVGGFYGL